MSRVASTDRRILLYSVIQANRSNKYNLSFSGAPRLQIPSEKKAKGCGIQDPQQTSPRSSSLQLCQSSPLRCQLQSIGTVEAGRSELLHVLLPQRLRAVRSLQSVQHDGRLRSTGGSSGSCLEPDSSSCPGNGNLGWFFVTVQGGNHNFSLSSLAS